MDIGSKTETSNSGSRNDWEKKVEVMVNSFLKVAPWHIVPVFKVLELLISCFFKIPLKHLSCCTETSKVTRENVRKLGCGRAFGKLWKNTYLILKGFGCRDSTGGF